MLFTLEMSCCARSGILNHHQSTMEWPRVHFRDSWLAQTLLEPLLIILSGWLSSYLRNLGRILHFGCEFFVFEVGRENEFYERIAEKELILAVIEAETHFVQISREMVRRDFMPRAHNATFEQRKGRFHGVGMNVAMRVLLRVIDSPVKVLLHLVERPRIDGR